MSGAQADTGMPPPGTSMRVVVTRPADQAAEWVAALQARGIDAAALPLIGIAPADDADAVRAAWARIGTLRLVVFVSPNASQQFFDAHPTHGAWPASVLAGSPGPGTTRTLIGLGVPRECIVEPAGDAAQFDSESLWAQLAGHDWHGAEVLVVRGEGGRDWLVDRLRDHGAQVVCLQAYRRTPPALTAQEALLLEDALAQPARHLWFFSSSQAIDNLADLGPAVRAADWSGAHAIATHPRIAERARQLGIANVTEARPTLDAVLACIQSIRS